MLLISSTGLHLALKTKLIKKKTLRQKQWQLAGKKRRGAPIRRAEKILPNGKNFKKCFFFGQKDTLKNASWRRFNAENFISLT